MHIHDTAMLYPLMLSLLSTSSPHS